MGNINKVANKLIIWLIIQLLNVIVHAQTPVLKVDLNISSRQEAEVNEPGYIPWPINSSLSSKIIEGVKFEFKNGTFEDTYYKTGVQAPYYARLVNDGMETSSIELHISGLQNGTHSLVTFHNAVSNPEGNTYGPIDIYVDREAKLTGIMETNRVLSNDLATTAFFNFEVNNNDTVVIRFIAQKAGVPFMINGFHLNSSDPKKMATFEYPADKDEHVDIDNDTLVLSWKAPENAVSQNVYFGKDETEVLSADPQSQLFVGNQTDTFFMKTGFYNMDNYFWRVDPIDSDGDTTKGDVWYFKKRIRSFPGAEGYGGYAIGGRGGKVVYVTNLNDNGPGSFRNAVENESGPRTILFNISGLITLNSRLVINDDYITVAGQTAPGKGICIRWAPIGVTGDDLIVQHLRVRLGIGITFDGMGLTGANNSIIDHCSVSWTIDEAFSSRGSKNITLQRTLISEALNAAGHSNYPPGTQHGYAASIGGDIGSFHHNLLAHCAGRNWSLAGGLDGDSYYAGRLDITNNVVYNWDGRTTDGGAHEVNFVNNYYKPGAAMDNRYALTAQHEDVGLGTQQYYFSGNVMPGYFDENNQEDGRTVQGSVPYETFVDDPFFESFVTTQSAGDALKYVLSDVGCTQPLFDEHDIRIIDETLTGTYSINGSVTGIPGLPDHEQDVGGWEAYTGYTRSSDWDTDLDGLPDWWEKAHDMDTLSAADDFSESNADADSNGYTNLEEYLQWMSKPHYFMNDQDSIIIDLSIYTRGFSNFPVFEITEVINGSAIVQNNTSLVNFKPSSEGFSELEFTVSDADGTSMDQRIGIFNGYMASDSMFTYTYYLDREGERTVTVDSVNTISEPEAIHTREKDLHTLNFAVYPNPANYRLNVMIEAEINCTFNLYITDITGRMVIHENRYIRKGINIIDIDISTLNSGMYLFEIRNYDLRKSMLFIKE